MKKDTGITLGELTVDGGASRDGFLMHFQADITGTMIPRPVVRETTALGAAYLAYTRVLEQSCRGSRCKEMGYHHPFHGWDYPGNSGGRLAAGCGKGEWFSLSP